MRGRGCDAAAANGSYPQSACLRVEPTKSRRMPRQKSAALPVWRLLHRQMQVIRGRTCRRRNTRHKAPKCYMGISLWSTCSGVEACRYVSQRHTVPQALARMRLQNSSPVVASRLLPWGEYDPHSWNRTLGPEDVGASHSAWHILSCPLHQKAMHC